MLLCYHFVYKNGFICVSAKRGRREKGQNVKILVFCQYYYPEPFRISDICEKLVRDGHEVKVVTGIPNYPLGKVYDGYKHGKKRDENINGVNVHRCFTVARRSGALFRIINYFSYSFFASRYVRKIKEDCDAVFVNQLSPVMMAFPALKYAKKHNKKVLLYCLDLWPENIIIGGIKRNSAIFKYFFRLSNKIYQKSDKILISSSMFEDYMTEKFGIAKEKIEYLPQYAETLFSPEKCAKTKENGYFDVMFAGNVGIAQDLETMVSAAYELKEHKNVRWHVVGDGSDIERLEKLVKEKELESVIFHGRHAVEEMPLFYGMADVMLITMNNDPIMSYTLPGKVQTYLAAGKAIVGAVDGETQKVINEARCGKCVPSGDYKKLAEAVLELSGEPEKIKEMSELSVQYYGRHFSKDKFFEKLTENLKKCAEK